MSAFLPHSSTFLSLEFLRSCFGAVLIFSLTGCSTNSALESQNLPWYIKCEQDTSYTLTRKWLVEVEDDGLPAQLPPPIRIHTLPDDPSQPWSVNYGNQRKEEISAGDEVLVMDVSEVITDRADR